MAKSRMRFSDILLVLSALIGIWIASQVHGMSQRHDKLVLYYERMALVSSVTEAGSSKQKLPVCVPMLPVELWNRDESVVPDPPRWRRRFI
jgi:hypothetical protein